jgi:DNA-binding NtrC family response regulator
MPTEQQKRIEPASRVLVIDDESRLRDMLVRSATEMGFKAVAARSAEQAMKLLESEGNEIDIVLLDLNLPGMDGMELLEQLKRRWPHTQVIVLTGFGSLEAAKKAIRLDVVDFLTKPCALEELEVSLARARRRRLESFEPEIPSSESHDELPLSETKDNAAPMTLEEVERVHILAALDRHDGNRAAAAAELGISERTLYYRLGQYQHRPPSA